MTPHETAMTSSSTQTRQQWISKRWLFVSTRTQLFQRRMNVARPNDPLKKEEEKTLGKFEKSFITAQQEHLGGL